MARDPAPAALTIDLDGAWCYRALHGVGRHDPASVGPEPLLADPLLHEALPRFLDVCARHGVHATLFAVTADVEADPGYAALLRDAARAGHEVASHSHSHRHDLARLPGAAIAEDLRKSRRLLRDVTGEAPVGFRAPGYHVSPAILQAATDAGFSYSSSLIPSPAYFALRAGVLLRARLEGRQGASQLGDPRAFLGPPSRNARGHRHPLHTGGLWEWPITTAAGLPWIGTTVLMLPDNLGDALSLLGTTAHPRREPLVFEFHAADFASGHLLPAQQPDARVPLATRLARLARVVQRLVGSRRVVRLRDLPRPS
jgi:hypothetical protein